MMKQIRQILILKEEVDVNLRVIRMDGMSLVSTDHVGLWDSLLKGRAGPPSTQTPQNKFL